MSGRHYSIIGYHHNFSERMFVRKSSAMAPCLKTFVSVRLHPLHFSSCKPVLTRPHLNQVVAAATAFLPSVAALTQAPINVGLIEIEPSVIKASNDTYSGMLIDLLDAIEANALKDGVELIFNLPNQTINELDPDFTFTSALASLQSDTCLDYAGGCYDVIATMFYHTYERAATPVVFSPAVAISYITLGKISGSNAPTTFDEANASSTPMCVSQSGLQFDILANLGFNVVASATREAMFASLEAGDCDLLGDDLVALSTGKPDNVEILADQQIGDTFYYAFPMRVDLDPQVLSGMEMWVLDAIDDGTVTALQEQYLNRAVSTTFPSAITINAGVIESSPLLAVCETDGETSYRGFQIDFLELLKEAALEDGVELTVVIANETLNNLDPEFSYTGTLAALQPDTCSDYAGGCEDMILGDFFNTAERALKATFTLSWLGTFIGVATLSDEAQSGADAVTAAIQAGSPICAWAGTLHYDLALAEGATNLVGCDSVRGCLDAVAAGDCVILVEDVMLLELNNNNPNIRILDDGPALGEDYSATGNTWPFQHGLEPAAVQGMYKWFYSITKSGKSDTLEAKLYENPDPCNTDAGSPATSSIGVVSVLGPLVNQVVAALMF